MSNEYRLKPNELLEIRGDRIFHDMFNSDEMDTIEWLVMKILNCKYEDIHGNVIVDNIRSTNLSKDDKEKYLDLVVHYNNKIVNIELNNNANGNYLRNACYIGNRVINSYLSGKDYDKITQGILVNLNWFTETENKKYPDGKIEEIWKYPTLKNDETTPKYFIKFININLCAFQNMCYNSIKSDDLVWKLFTIKDKDELNNYAKKENLLKNYCNKLNRLSKDKEYCRMIWDNRLEESLRNHDAYMGGKEEGYDLGKIDGYDLGKTDGYNLGKTDGYDLGKIEIIVNLYSNGLSLDLISKLSGLSENEIKKILKSNQKK